MRIWRRHATLIAFLFCLTLFGVQGVASADSAMFIFNIPETTPCCIPPGPGPFGTMTLNLNSNGTIALNLQANPGFQLGALFLNAPQSTFSGLPGGWFQLGIGACDPQFGCFSSVIMSQGEFGLPQFPVSSLSLTLTGPTAFTSVFDVAQLGATDNSPFVLNIVNLSDTAQGASGATLVAEPSTFALIVSALSGFAVLRRHRA